MAKKVVELLAMTNEELRKKLDEARRDLLKIKMSIRSGVEKNVSKKKKQKKLVAQILTAIRSKEISELTV